MAKRANDLLDVFRNQPAEGASPRRRKASGGKTSGGRKATRGRRAPEGLVLEPRQALLASSVVVLLLVLAFTIGLGVGRGGFGDDRPELKKNTPTYYWIRGALQSHDAVGGRPVDREALLKELGRELRLARRNVAAVPADGDLLHVYVGWWTSRAQAEDYLRLKRLDALRLRWGAPFHFAEIVEGPRPR